MERIYKTENILKIILAMCLLLICPFCFAACGEVKVTTSVSFGFKQSGSSTDGYNANVTEFNVGERFYSAIDIRIVTNKEDATTFNVEIIIPKTEQVDMTDQGGIRPKEINEDKIAKQTVLKYDINSTKNTVQQTLLFNGVPYDSGTAQISVNIYKKNGELVKGHYVNIFFEYIE